MGKRLLGSEAPRWVVYVIPLLFPAGFLLAYVVGRLVPGLPGGAFAAIGIGVPILLVAVLAVRDQRVGRKNAGLVPARKGFSAKVELLSDRLRKRAETLETALRFGREVDRNWELESLADEVKRTAEEVDKRDLLSGFAVSIPEEDELGDEDEFVAETRRTLEAHVRRLEHKAHDLGSYAEDVKARGGVYRLGDSERFGCALMLLALLGGAGWLIAHAEGTGDGKLWWGIALIVLAILGAWVAVRMQREPA